MNSFVAETLHRLLQALPTTFALWLLAVTLGTLVGVILSLGRVYASPAISRAVAVYIDVIRGTPMLVQMFILYFAMPEVGVVLSAFTAAVLAIGLNSAAYQAEYLRAGLLAVPDNQMAAAQAIGLNQIQSLRYVILPQAFRLAFPSLSNELVVELQYSSLAFTIGVVELTGMSQKVCYETYRCVDVFILCGIIYFVITGLVVSACYLVTRRFRISSNSPTPDALNH